MGLALLGVLWLAADADERPGVPAAAGHATGSDAALPAPVAVLEVRGFGAIRIELLPEAAPRAVEHFVERAQSGAYDGSALQGIVGDSVIQVGSVGPTEPTPRRNGRDRTERSAPNNPDSMAHTRGAVSMAERNGSEGDRDRFLVVLESAPHLDGDHRVFGRVVEGLELLDRIAALEPGSPARAAPSARNLVIEGIRIEPPAEALDENPEAGEDAIQEYTPRRERIRLRLCLAPHPAAG